LKTSGDILESDLIALQKKSNLSVIVRELPKMLSIEIETDDPQAIIDFDSKKKVII
jgi:hypothetical protein